MNKPRWRLRPLVVLAAVALAAAGLFSAWFLTLGFLRGRLADVLPPGRLDRVLDEFVAAFAAYSAISLVMTAMFALLLGSYATGALARVRERVLSLATRADRPAYRPRVFELSGVVGAIERMADEFEGREITLTRERDQLALLVSSVSEGILLLGDDGRIIHANPAAQSLLGLPEACHGQPLRSFIRNAQVRSIVDRLKPGESPLTNEVTIDDRRLLVVSRPLRKSNPMGPPDVDAPGAVVGFVDLTEVRRLEGVRRDFVANVSHELKTPLTSIRGYVETLLSDDLDPDLRKQFLDVIQKNADRLHSIVEDLLDLSRIESGGWRPDLEDVSAARIVSDVWESMADRARARDIRFEPPDNDAVLRADRSALRQILSNLFDNALRYTAPGGAIRVRVITSADGAGTNGTGVAGSAGLVTLEVSDDGSGIPSDALPRIFERFYRVDPARSRAEGGTGLGLSIVKHLAESMNGDVAASSELGKGTTIRVRLPGSGTAQ
jgi:two-component system phosphate regulon sensor histidine kinase PhoR